MVAEVCEALDLGAAMRMTRREAMMGSEEVHSYI